MDFWKSKVLVLTLLVLSFVAMTFLFFISHWDTIETIIPQGARLSTSPLSPTPKQDYSYTNVISGEKSQRLQINGIIESVGSDWIVILAKDNRYTISTTPASYLECRQEYITDVSGAQIPAYSIFLDLTHYILNLEQNGKTMVEKGQLFSFSDMKTRIAKDKHALAVTDKDNALFLLIVYGCQ